MDLYKGLTSVCYSLNSCGGEDLKQNVRFSVGMANS